MSERFFNDEDIINVLMDWETNQFDEYDLADIYGCSSSTILNVIHGRGAYTLERLEKDSNSKYSREDRLAYVNGIWDAREAGFTDQQIADMLGWKIQKVAYWGGSAEEGREVALRKKKL